ncbi:Predicted dehydrogenase [Singulisphaera sp. GP187]|uniref:Gfo/Idh/MocA family protein n=1 Tax=Singulisphaera sp. GP187 TaxID=1882752 RepID=UPI00092750C7|nr:Gfo/Idh/MocA family oxidoreductase [Singulisphaera sp. GP187]SIO41069.1 Predicted dehydrogenase [Singulisphaera sp. GP187]
MKRQTILIIGVGSIGERHLRCFQATGRADVRLVEINPELRRTVAERYGVSKHYPDLDSALQEPPDVAVVATPAQTHIPIATRLAEAGIHLLIEKPLSTSEAGIDRLQSIVNAQKLVAAVAYVHRAHPLLQAMRQAILDQRFGRPVELIVVTGQNFPTYRPAYRSIYYNDHATGGGAIQDALTHMLNAGEWLVGPIDRLVADAAHQVLEGVDVEDTAHVLARQGRLLASYSLNQHQWPNELTITVVCEHGAARFEPHAHRWRWMLAKEETWHDESIAPLERDTLFITQASAFLDAVEGQRAPLCSLDEGLQTLRVNLAALASVKTQSWQTVGGS